jgi:hypothetical protein
MRVILAQVIIWSIVAIMMVAVFAQPGTMVNWGDDKLKTLLLAILVFLGYGSDLSFRFYARSKRWGYKQDERDININIKAVNIGMIALILYVYVFSIMLYARYETAGLLPVGWMWFLGYSSIVLANISIRLASLLLYIKHGY